MLTTHYMDEAEQLCDRLVIMDGGHIVAEGSPRELVAQHSTREVVELRFFDGDARDKALPRLIAGAGHRVEALPDRVLVYTDDGDAIADARRERRRRSRLDVRCAAARSRTCS